MDPDAEAEQTASTILRTTFISVVFTACHSYKTETNVSVNNIQFSLPDSTKQKKSDVTSTKKKKKTIYLTFDDGPNKGTRKVMHIAEEEQIPITMFLIGEQVYGSREQTATYDSLLLNNYVEISNHSYSHAGNAYSKFYTMPDSVANDFMRCEDSLRLSSKIIRTPGRNIWRTTGVNSTDLKNSTAAADSLQSKGFTVVGWDLEWHFNNALNLENTDDEILQQVDSIFSKGKTKTPDHLVLLAHDQVYADATDSATLRNFMQKLKNKDEYNFEVISNYPGISKD
ncbi:polysaccharide deacetylase family protein [Ferruginibacter sp. SUN002]|uniref:polysaccharide deacetylase family protein n=1 Tax=Ferruginibacter sp. SUN002 TaxID=2937789 RepID=UPI003D36998C